MGWAPPSNFKFCRYRLPLGGKINPSLLLPKLLKYLSLIILLVRVFQAILVTWKRLTHLDLFFAGFGVFICQQLRHLSEIYFRNLLGNDLCMNALWWVSHLSSLNIFAQVASTFKREQKFASGYELAPFSFSNMVASMPTSCHALVLENVNFTSHLIFLWII